MSTAADCSTSPATAPAPTPRVVLPGEEGDLSRLLGLPPERFQTSVSGDWRSTQLALENLRALPSLKNRAQRFARAVADDYCLLDEVVVEVGHDPALAANVLRLANSAAVGPRQRVVDLTTALQLLGVVRVRRLADLLAAMDESRGLAPGFNWGSLWLHSAACAALAARLGEWAGEHVSPELSVAGLLHDIGKIALSTVAPEAYREVLMETWMLGGSLAALEQSRLGMDHREAGWIFGREADLPPRVLSAIAFHDEPDRAPPDHRPVVATVAVANHLAKSHRLGFSGESAGSLAGLAASAAWTSWQKTLDRPLDPDALITELRAEWLPAIRAELAVLGGEEG